MPNYGCVALVVAGGRQRTPAEPERKERGWWPWDWAGRIKDAVFGSIGDAINDWIRGIVESALAPVFDLRSVGEGTWKRLTRLGIAPPR